MKIQIRQNVFETNSSSTHSITICMKDQFTDWKDGKLLYDNYDEKFIESKEEFTNEESESYCDDYLTYDKFMDMDYETYVNEYKTPKGEEVVAFGYYGNDY